MLKFHVVIRSRPGEVFITRVTRERDPLKSRAEQRAEVIKDMAARYGVAQSKIRAVSAVVND